jgi:penicillin amidase
MKPGRTSLSAFLLRAGLAWLGRGRLPQIDGRLRAEGLSESVEVIRDRWGVPHIYATNLHDLLFAQGFVHAQDRLWQMELHRRTASGRLSEMLGEAGLEMDRATRTFGFRRLAEADWVNAPDDLREAVLAYTQGVNAYLRGSAAHMPIEFTLLRHRPEPWQPRDSMAIVRLMVWQFTFGWMGKIMRGGLAEVLGLEGIAELDVDYPECAPLTLPRGIELNRAAFEGSLRGSGPDQGMGSNAWAVSGLKSATGRPFLCNDMHVGVVLPSLWYEVHLVGGPMNVTGVSAAGTPLVLAGHNAHLAWGFTMSFTDGDDLYLERFHPQDPLRYEFRGEWLEAQVAPETIHIKGRAQPHVEQVVATRHGPIISGVIGSPEQRIAVRSMALRPCESLRGWLLLNQARNWDEFVEAMRHIQAPHLNVVYADVEGNIGYWLTGAIPLRAKGQGLIPVLGWSGEYEWVGEIPFAEMPHALNPSEGYLVSCNNCVVPDSYPYFLGSIWANPHRASRLGELIGPRGGLGVTDFCAMQQDLVSIPGRAFVERLKGLSTNDSDVRLALDILRAWDGRLDAASCGGAVYEVTLYALVHTLLEPKLGRELTNRLTGHGHDSTLVLRFLGAPSSEWLARAGGRQALLMASLKQAVGTLRQKLGLNPDDWQWGRLHLLTFSHVMAQRKPLDQVFNLGPWPFGGDADTLCQSAISPDDPYTAKEVAPTYRQVVDLGDLSRSLSIHAPGQSGQLGSRHYADLAAPWLKGEYHPMLWTRADIEHEAEGMLRLVP